MDFVLDQNDAADWIYRGEGAANLVLAYAGSSPAFVRSPNFNSIPFIFIKIEICFLVTIKREKKKNCLVERLRGDYS